MHLTASYKDNHTKVQHLHLACVPQRLPAHLYLHSCFALSTHFSFANHPGVSLEKISAHFGGYLSPRCFQASHPCSAMPRYHLAAAQNRSHQPTSNILIRANMFVAGGWRLAAGGWWLAAGGWWLVAGGWRLAAGGYLVSEPIHHILDSIPSGLVYWQHLFV
jgi:hypothetical protein